MTSPKGKNIQKVLDYLSEHQFALPMEIADATGLSPEVVRSTMYRMRKSGGLKNRRTIIVDMKHAPRAFEWLLKSCPEGVSISEFAASIIVDAMAEDTTT